MTNQTDQTHQISEEFAPRWTGCAGMFNEGNGLDSRQNEEVHYRKHGVLGKEWGPALSLSEYRAKATQHLDNLDAGEIVELCQAEDVAVVKFNLKTGDLGIARRDDGTIKTYFRPGDVQYVLRKLQDGLWGSPDIVDGFELNPPSDELSQDPEQRYLLERLEVLSLEVATQSHGVVDQFLRSEPSSQDLLSLVARISECRFLAFELRRRVLTSEQEDVVFALRKRIAIANASLQGLERHRGTALVAAIRAGVDLRALDQSELWRNATDVVGDAEMFGSALDERQALAFILMELRILQFTGRLRDLELDTWEQQLRKSDLYLRKHFYTLARRHGYHEANLVVPEDFFWRRMAPVEAEAPGVV